MSKCISLENFARKGGARRKIFQRNFNEYNKYYTNGHIKSENSFAAPKNVTKHSIFEHSKSQFDPLKSCKMSRNNNETKFSTINIKNFIYCLKGFFKKSQLILMHTYFKKQIF